MRPLAVLRPEPGNARTAARIAAAGGTAVRLPLFAVVPMAWEAPDPATYDALLVTSANAMRHGGERLAVLGDLPVLAVGAATAAAARGAGFRVEMTGNADAGALVAAAGGRRLLHLAGRDRVRLVGVDAIAVYAAAPIAEVGVSRLVGSIALVHSARAARRLAELVDAGGIDRSALRIATLSGAVAAAVGPGWGGVAVAPLPTDAALVAAAIDAAD